MGRDSGLGAGFAWRGREVGGDHVALPNRDLSQPQRKR